MALGAYAVQLVLNLSWTLVFFGLEAPEAALVVIAALLVAIVVTMVRFWAPRGRLGLVVRALPGLGRLRRQPQHGHRGARTDQRRP